MCGINIIVFYSSIIFEVSGIDVYIVFWVSFGFGFINFFFVWFVVYMIDIFGCCFLFFFMFFNMFWSFLVVGFCYLIDGDKEESIVRLVVVVIFVYIFVVFYFLGLY